MVVILTTNVTYTKEIPWGSAIDAMDIISKIKLDIQNDFELGICWLGVDLRSTNIIQGIGLKKLDSQTKHWNTKCSYYSSPVNRFFKLQISVTGTKGTYWLFKFWEERDSVFFPNGQNGQNGQNGPTRSNNEINWFGHIKT